MSSLICNFLCNAIKHGGDSGINMELVVWISDPEAGEPNLRSDLNWAIWAAFQRENIEIPYPQRVIHLQGKPLAAS